MPYLHIKDFFFMLKLVKKSFNNFGDFSKSGSKSNDYKEIGKVYSYVVWFNKIGNFKEFVRLSR